MSTLAWIVGLVVVVLALLIVRDVLKGASPARPAPIDRDEVRS